MTRRNIRTAALGLAFPAASVLASPVTWNFDITTTGNDVAWLAPTATAADAAFYDVNSTITLVAVNVRWTIFNLGPFDITDQIPPELQSQHVVVSGPAPVEFANIPVVYPDPPAAPAVAGTLSFGINASGFGNASLTDVTLGETQIDLGSPFGVQTVTITRVRIVGTAVVLPIYYGDTDMDGDVDLTDLAILLTNFGSTQFRLWGDGDFDGDEDVDLTDLAVLLSSFGRS